MARHMGVRLIRPSFHSPHLVMHRGREIGRIEHTPTGAFRSVVKIRGTYTPLKLHPTRVAAMSHVVRNATRPPGLTTPKLIRPKASVFRVRKHPTQSLGV